MACLDAAATNAATPDPGDAHVIRWPASHASDNPSLDTTLTALSADRRTAIQECTSNFSFLDTLSLTQGQCR